MDIKPRKVLTIEKWQQFPFYKQILMIANELNRAKNWLSKKDFQEVKGCYERALELADLTVDVLIDKRYLKELLRFREVLAEMYIDNEFAEKQNNKLITVLLLFDKDSYNILAGAK